MLGHWFISLFQSGESQPEPAKTYSNEVELKPRQRRQIIVAHNGKDYVVELDELPNFLAQIEEETPAVVVKRAATKRTKKPAPVVKLVEAPEDSKSLILEQLSATNRLIRTEWASAVQNYLAYKAAVELAQDEEDIELLLMAA